MEPVIRLRDITRDYVGGDTLVQALRGVSLDVFPGEMVAIMGPSGSGKSTLLNTLGCLDRPTSGTYDLDGEPVADLDDDDLAAIRNERLGFVFQGYNLLPRTTALENVMLPMVYDRGGRFTDMPGRAAQALALVGLESRQHHQPNELSGGQQQRVAIARALVTSPSVLLADEPTGNLDTHTTAEIMALFQALNDSGVTIVVITHEDEVAAWCKRAVTLRDGQIASDISVAQRRVAAELAAKEIA
jgi:putative ABC transport system ATP-binding protein